MDERALEAVAVAVRLIIAEHIGMPYMARSSEFVSEDSTGEQRERELKALRAADEEADEANERFLSALALAAYTAIFDSLLDELPEEAVEKAATEFFIHDRGHEAEVRPWSERPVFLQEFYRDEVRPPLRAFVWSLRDTKAGDDG